MSNVSDIFKARAESFGSAMLGGSGNVSFKIPEYQRPYDWDMKNVQRLLSDCLNGLKHTADQSARHPFTFLGTIITVGDDAQESVFDGESQLVVDGQQRLTTLILLSCALCASLRYHKADVNKVSNHRVRTWLEDELLAQSEYLYRCTTGQLQGFIASDPFPRIVRTGDVRGRTFADSEYESGIANLLTQFRAFCLGQKNDFSPQFNSSERERHLLVIYKSISELIETHVYAGQASTDDEEFSLHVLKRSEFQRRGCRDLFVKLKTAADADHIASRIAEEAACEGIVRLLLFSSYVMQSVVLTVVQAPTEDVAFDIFDALNTTGEPLTALETLKPHVVRFERDEGTGYSGSASESDWQVIEENVIAPHVAPETQKRESQELVTGFALYYVGQKIGSDLKEQRNSLRSYFFNQTKAQNIDDARKFVQHLADFARYRQQYWRREGINELVGRLNEQDDYDMLKLCLRFMRDTNTSLTIPVLARYQIEFGEMDRERNFLNAVKATAAFLALRRAMTGGTARIDTDFRDIMSGVRGASGNGLCLGESLSNPILALDDLKAQMRLHLAKAQRSFDVRDKETWLSLAREVPLARQSSRVVCRFLILAAAHNARLDEKSPGLSTREDVIQSKELNFLNHDVWTGEQYATVEHVAPESSNSTGWNTDIYRHPDTRNTIGNLVLLPEKENVQIGNAPWTKKKLFYRALIAKTSDEREACITSAEKEGLKFGNKTRNLLAKQGRLHMLDALGPVEDWTVETIQKRTENILSLAWDEISPWLFN